MADIKFTDLTADIIPTSDDIVATVDASSGANKKVQLGDLSQALDYTQSISIDTNNLLAIGSDDLLRLEVDADVISADTNNTLSKGSDGKLYGSATALALNENELFVGNASNIPVSTSANDVRQVLGLPTDYIKDAIEYVNVTQVTWQGSCRDSSDVRDFTLGSATTATLSSATANTTYNLFVAGNTLTDTPVVVWGAGSTPAGYTYYRRVLSIVTDGVGNIIEFSVFNNNNESKIVYNNGGITEYAAVLPSNSNLDQIITVPSVDLEVELFASSFRGSGVGLTKIVNTNSTILPVDLTEVNSDIIASGASVNDLGFGRQFININNGQIKLLQSSNESSLFRLSTRAYKIWR